MAKEKKEMRESTDTSGGFELLPEGKIFHFTVIGRPEKFRAANGGTYRKWIFSVKFPDGSTKKRKITIMPSDAKEMLLCLGGTQNPDNKNAIDWDDEEVDGKTFNGEVQHRKYKRKDGTEGISEILVNCLPF